MTLIESRSYCRVVVTAPGIRVDVALPADVPIIDLLPMLLRFTGESSETSTGWQLTRPGHGALPGGRTLRAVGVVDGEALQLVRADEHVPEPIFDDVVDAIAHARRAHLNSRSSNPGLAAAVIVAVAIVGAVTILQRSGTVADACLGGAFALVLLGVATAVARTTSDRIVATATAAGGIALAFVCGLKVATDIGGSSDAWGVLLGAGLALAYSLVAALATRGGRVVFIAVATASLLAALSALATGLADVDVIRIIGATAAVAFGALPLLPRLAVRLARLPIPDVTPSPPGESADVTVRAQVAARYLVGTQLGCAATVAFSALLLGLHASALSLSLAAAVLVAMSLRARAEATLAIRIAFAGSAAASATGTAMVLALTGRGGNGVAMLVVEGVVGAVAVLIGTGATRRAGSPPMRRLVDYVESVVTLAIVPLAVGVLGLYSALRQH